MAVIAVMLVYRYDTVTYRRESRISRTESHLRLAEPRGSIGLGLRLSGYPEPRLRQHFLHLWLLERFRQDLVRTGFDVLMAGKMKVSMRSISYRKGGAHFFLIFL
jgi:hypothetical protein